MRAEVQDDFGKVNFMLANNRRSATLDQYLNNGGKKPKDGEIVFVYGSKGDDIIFGEKLTPKSKSKPLMCTIGIPLYFLFKNAPLRVRSNPSTVG